MPSARKSKTKPEIVIPERLFFRIGEVARLSSLPTYVLRFWETEFPQLKPTKSSSGQRMYRRRDVEFVLEIKKLLYEDGFTIAGAREKLKAETRTAKSQSALLPFPKHVRADRLKAVRQGLQEILGLLAPKRQK